MNREKNGLIFIDSGVELLSIGGRNAGRADQIQCVAKAIDIVCSVEVTQW